MSVQALTWVLEHSSSEGASRLVLISLANHASSDGTNAYPSVETIRREAQLKSRRTVQNALRKLVEDGAIEIEVEPGPRGQGRYRVLLSNAPAQNMRSASDDVGGAHLATPGGASGDSRVKGTVLEPSKEPSSEVERIWAYYIERIPSRRQLGDKQRRQIRAALAVRSEEEIKCAIDGIAVSPHHRGENDRRKRYQDLHYAIVPRGEESIEERIDKAIGWAKEFGGPGASIDPDRANRWLEDIRTFLARRANNPAATAGLDRAKEAYENARAAGLAVLKVNGPPWARYAE